MGNRIITEPDPSSPRPSGPEDVVATPLASAPAAAKAIAVAKHEPAAWGYDEALEAHWTEVLRLVEPAPSQPSAGVESVPRSVPARACDTSPAHAVAARSSRARRPWSLVAGALAACQALAMVTALAASSRGRVAQLDPEDAMVQEFQSFCADYYTQAQCTGAVRFILRTAGSEYFVHLHNDESPDGFLDRLAAAVEGGEALRASESLAAKTGE
jgi:hypothetical protein